MRDRSLSERKIQYIPSTKSEAESDKKGKRVKRVAAYCRVSTDSKEQETSFDSQVRYYTGKINSNPDWEIVNIYADPAVSGTSRRNRLQFDQMIYDCLHGRIDIIITKSMSRFARNQLDCLAVIKLLKGLKPPVTVLFEDDHIDSSDLSTEVVMTIFSMLAEQESARKSSGVIWGFERRKEQGFYLTPTHNLLGYDKTEALNKDDREMIIVEDEANIVRLIFYMFLVGFKVSEIANTLTNAGAATSKGNTVWNSSSVLGILKNERYAGDVRTNKTFSDFSSHHTYKNRGERSFIYETDHHPAIVNHEIYKMAQKLIASHKYGYDPYINGSYSLRVIESGLLQGFIPINVHWAGSKLKEYIELAKTVPHTADFLKGFKKIPYYPGCEFIRPQDISHSRKVSLKISPASLSLSINSVKVIDSDYLEFLLDPIDMLIAVRPTKERMPGAICWKKRKDGKNVSCSMAGGAFTKLIYELMGWTNLWNVSVLAQAYTSAGNSVLIFDLSQYEINALPYEPPKKIKKRENNDVYYDIELMIAQQIELLHKKQVGDVEYDVSTDDEENSSQARPKRKKLHPQEWINSFGEKSERAATQNRRCQAQTIKDWELDSGGTTPPEFDYSVKIENGLIEKTIASVNNQNSEEVNNE